MIKAVLITWGFIAILILTLVLASSYEVIVDGLADIMIDVMDELKSKVKNRRGIKKKKD